MTWHPTQFDAWNSHGIPVSGWALKLHSKNPYGSYMIIMVKYQWGSKRGSHSRFFRQQFATTWGNIFYYQVFLSIRLTGSTPLSKGPGIIKWEGMYPQCAWFCCFTFSKGKKIWSKIFPGFAQNALSGSSHSSTNTHCHLPPLVSPNQVEKPLQLHQGITFWRSEQKWHVIVARWGWDLGAKDALIMTNQDHEQASQPVLLQIFTRKHQDISCAVSFTQRLFEHRIWKHRQYKHWGWRPVCMWSDCILANGNR